MRGLEPHHLRRLILAGLSLALGTSVALLPALAHAAPTPFVVIGTSDVSDSDLMAAVIEPRFEAAYPQYDLQYVAKGTGAALTDARNGLAAVAIVHAASIENGLVSDGYSLEPAGRLIFWGDYVLLGPTSDPAGVAAAAPHDIVTAFEKVAAAGAAGQASFVTRGGTPGTAVQEHAIWGMTSGVPVCTVTSTNSQGGGKRPTVTADNGQPCSTATPPTADDQATAPWPTWYHSGNSGSQATNVGVASTCPTGTFPNGNCYVFTDRGTFKYMQSQGLAQNLKIVTRDNSPSARGGREALINVFHAYGINPAKFPNPSATKTDPVAANLFLNFLTSPSTQQAIGDFLRTGTDQAFVPAAAPTLTGSFTSDSAVNGKKTKIAGNLANVVPGYPALSNVTVNLLAAVNSSPLAIPEIVASTTTDANGNYAFKQKLEPGLNYRVGVGAITKVELPSLSPPFSDVLAPTTTTLGTVGGVKVKRAVAGNGGDFQVVGAVQPKVDRKGKLVVMAKALGGDTGEVGKKGKLHRIGRLKLLNGDQRFVYSDHLAAGKYLLVLTYKDNGEILPGVSKKVRLSLS